MITNNKRFYINPTYFDFESKKQLTQLSKQGKPLAEFITPATAFRAVNHPRAITLVKRVFTFFNNEIYDIQIGAGVSNTYKQKILQDFTSISSAVDSIKGNLQPCIEIAVATTHIEDASAEVIHCKRNNGGCLKIKVESELYTLPEESGKEITANKTPNTIKISETTAYFNDKKLKRGLHCSNITSPLYRDPERITHSHNVEDLEICTRILHNRHMSDESQSQGSPIIDAKMSKLSLSQYTDRDVDMCEEKVHSELSIYKQSAEIIDTPEVKRARLQE